MDGCRLVIARHGQTEGNAAGVHQGRTDSPLTERGVRQADVLGEEVRRWHPGATAVYTSPLGRAAATAASVGRIAGLPVRTDPGLVEGSFGAWEGATMAQLDERRFWERATADPDYAAPGGESLRGCGERAAASFRSIAARHPGETVIVVTHQGPICQGLAVLLGTGFPGFAYGLANGGLCELVIEGGEARIERTWRARPVDL